MLGCFLTLAFRNVSYFIFNMTSFTIQIGVYLLHGLYLTANIVNKLVFLTHLAVELKTVLGDFLVRERDIKVKNSPLVEATGIPLSSSDSFAL